MAQQVKERRSERKSPRNAHEWEEDILPKGTRDRVDAELEEDPDVLGREVAEKMLEIARQYFPPATAEKDE